MSKVEDKKEEVEKKKLPYVPSPSTLYPGLQYPIHLHVD